MNILFLTTLLDVGGVETNIVRLAGEFGAKGHKIAVASRAGVLAADLVATGATHIPLSMSWRDVSSVIADVRTLRRMLSSEHFDAVHLFSASAAALLWLVLRCPPNSHRRKSIPVVSSVMGLHSSPDEPTWRVMIRTWVTCIGARRVIIIAPAIGNLIRRLPISDSRIVERAVVGVSLPSTDERDHRDVARVREELGIGPREHVVMTIGGLAPRKSHELFLRGAAIVLSKRSDVRFFVVGEGSTRIGLEQEISDLGIASHVRLLGERTDITPLLSATDVYVRPGVVEGFIGITVLEAQALGVPVVSFETEDVRLAIRHGHTGLLVARCDVTGLADAIASFLDDPDMAATIGRNGREHVQRTFSLPIVAAGLESLYRDLIASSV